MNFLNPLIGLLEDKITKTLNRKEVEEKLDEINLEIEQKLKEMSISGLSLFSMLSKGKLPSELDKIINDVTSRNLSARGSRNVPRTVLWFFSRAMRPSKTSVSAAVIKR